MSVTQHIFAPVPMNLHACNKCISKLAAGHLHEMQCSKSNMRCLFEKLAFYGIDLALYAAGHIGFLGRAAVFVFVGVLFIRLIVDPDLNDSNKTTIGNDLAQLQKNRGGRACLFILGFFLIVYGLFAVSTMLPCLPDL